LSDRAKKLHQLRFHIQVFQQAKNQMRKIISSLFFITLFLQANIAYSASSDWHENQSKGAKTKLVASFYELKDQNGEKKLIAGIHFKLASGWKIYGNGSDGIGLPPKLDFAGSKNYAKHEIIWPEATMEEEKIGKDSIKFYTYKNDVILPIEIDVTKISDATELNLKLEYGLCKDICVPASENFSLKISDAIDVEVLQDIQKFYPSKILAAENTEVTKPTKRSHFSSLVLIMLTALIGGAILNIMPCVLPVLSIKLLSVINHSNAPISKIRFAFISTVLGILFCFVVFAFFASIIKFTGNSFGWGLQFQNPYFLIFLVTILILFIGNLLGVFELSFDQVLTTLLNKKISEGEKKKNIFAPNFLSGILAVLLATPCSAPFLGSAISFALVQDFYLIFLIFLFIGLGFASPYIALSIRPQLVNLLPKPGSWMLQTKQLMVGFLAATVIWLIYILSHNIGAMPSFVVGIISLVILFALKIKSVFAKCFTIAIAVILIFSLPIDLQKRYQSREEFYDQVWSNFDEARIYEYVSQGKVVVIDITADWCITCKFNKIRVLQDKEVMEKLKRGDIIAMRGDITRPNEEIMNFLHKNNRFAIPFNAVYGPNAKTGLLASELLTKDALLEMIEKAR
jgi:suppressor for copper-sensitivity B